jgi:phosphate transport system substrate-binding protein
MSLRRLALVLLAAACCSLTSCSGSDGVTLQGSGATFPAPLYKRWFLEYYKKTEHNVRVSYQAIGSGAGIRQFSEGLTHFGATDAALNDKEVKKFDAGTKIGTGVQMLPLTAGTVVLAYNVPGLSSAKLKLSREAYVGIFLKKIKSWNDPILAKINEGVTLPKLPITVVRRAEGSGTTYVFTSHLSAISKEWKDGPGKGKSIVWPTGLGGRGNAGVAALIQQTPGAIGYLEYGYAELTKLPDGSSLPMAVLQNKEGEWVEPTPDSSKAALEQIEIPANLAAANPDPAGKKSYPIVTYTWMLCYKQYRDPKVAKTIRDVFEFCLSDEAQKYSAQLGYIPLPERVRTKVLKALRENVR